MLVELRRRLIRNSGLRTYIRGHDCLKKQIKPVITNARQAAKELREEHGVTYGAYGGTTAYKNCLYSLRRRMPIPKSLERSSGLRINAYEGTTAYKNALPRVTAIKKTTAVKVYGGRKEHVIKGYGD